MPGIPSIPINFWTYKDGLSSEGIAGIDGPGRAPPPPEGWPEAFPLTGWAEELPGVVDEACWYAVPALDDIKKDGLGASPDLSTGGGSLAVTVIDGFYGYGVSDTFETEVFRYQSEINPALTPGNHWVSTNAQMQAEGFLDATRCSSGTGGGTWMTLNDGSNTDMKVSLSWSIQGGNVVLTASLDSVTVWTKDIGAFASVGPRIVPIQARYSFFGTGDARNYQKVWVDGDLAVNNVTPFGHGRVVSKVTPSAGPNLIGSGSLTRIRNIYSFRGA